jgi:hypothetical protein
LGEITKRRLLKVWATERRIQKEDYWREIASEGLVRKAVIPCRFTD